MPIEHIEKTDTLNEGREKLNNAITAFNETVVEGDSSVEAAQARVDEKGVPHPTLKARIDDGFEKTSQQLAQTEQELALGLSRKVDQAVFDISTQEIKFYADDRLIDTVDISEASNAQAVQEYIDSLVTDGQIEGVVLAKES